MEGPEHEQMREALDVLEPGPGLGAHISSPRRRAPRPGSWDLAGLRKWRPDVSDRSHRERFAHGAGLRAGCLGIPLSSPFILGNAPVAPISRSINAGRLGKFSLLLSGRTIVKG
jgi:hypothetical protein